MKERVLTYQLAQTLTLDELQKVSGGAGGFPTSYTTVGGSGDSRGNLDGRVDTNWDW